MEAEAMKSHDFLVGMIILSISIVIFGVLLSQSIDRLGSNLFSAICDLNDLRLTIVDTN